MTQVGGRAGQEAGLADGKQDPGQPGQEEPQPREETAKLPLHEAERQLLEILDTRPFLLVLDGLERLLIAYARLDAAHLADDDREAQRAAERILGNSQRAR